MAVENSTVAKLEAHKAPLTVIELAEILGKSKFTIYQWVKSNRIPHMRPGSSVMFDPKQTAEWLRERCA
jgi:excisionase family DNA binding protein